MVPNAFTYLVTTFFYPPILKGQTVLVPPILRPAIVDADPVRGEHLLVYSSGAEGEVATLRESGLPCRVYGMRGGPTEGTVDGNIEFKPRSNEGFVEDLRTARAVITGGGFSLMSEAVYLGKPMIAMPLQGQVEQLMNSRYLEREGFGTAASELTPGRAGSVHGRHRPLRGAARRVRAGWKRGDAGGGRKARRGGGLGEPQGTAQGATTDPQPPRRRPSRRAR